MTTPDQHGPRSADGPPRVDVLGVRISCLTLDSAVEKVTGWVSRGEHRYVCVTGVHGVMECQRDPQLLGIHNQSGLTTPDGMPMVWSARWAGQRDVSRVYGPDLMLAVLTRAVERGWSSFFYGGGAGTAELLAERLTTRFPGLQVAGTSTPPFRPLTPQEDADIVQAINDSGAQLVWVGLSTPKQERWMAEHVGRLRANALFGVGAAFDLHAGTIPQAPRWMQRSGLEWTYRLGREPRRLWRRYLRNNPAFVLNVLAHPPRLAQTRPRIVPHGRVGHHTGSIAMSVADQRSDARPALAIGDVVEVKPAQEILAGLDERGELDALPFMPEMLQFCGRRFVVDKIAFKTCDTVTWTGLRRMTDTVHLAGVRCDGQAHGGCQAGCLIFWKTAWLTRVPGSSQEGLAAQPTAQQFATPEQSAQRQPGTNGRPKAPQVAGRSGCTRERLTEVAMSACRPRDIGAASDRPVYSCQATELTRAAPVGIPFWDVTQYVQDVRTGNAPVRQVVRGIVIGAFNRMQDLTRRTLPARLRIRGGQRYPFISGTADRGHAERLDLQPGEWVRVKSIEQISATLNTDNSNRGLSFDREMLKYCGRTAQVLRRVDHIIDELSGQMLTMKTPCIVLADVVCTADYHRSCPRGIYPYWREIWLERVPAPLRTSQAAGDRS